MPLAMNAAREHRAAPSRRRPSVRKRGCLISFALIALTVLLAAIRVYHPRFKSSSPSEIEMLAWQHGRNENHSERITSPSNCSSIINVFKQGTWTIPHMCKDRARFKIQYENGTVDYVDFMPGHDGPEFCEIRMGLGHYRLSRKELFEVLREAGVDTSKIPVN